MNGTQSEMDQESSIEVAPGDVENNGMVVLRKQCEVQAEEIAALRQVAQMLGEQLILARMKSNGTKDSETEAGRIVILERKVKQLQNGLRHTINQRDHFRRLAAPHSQLESVPESPPKDAVGVIEPKLSEEMDTWSVPESGRGSESKTFDGASEPSGVQNHTLSENGSSNLQEGVQADARGLDEAAAIEKTMLHDLMMENVKLKEKLSGVNIQNQRNEAQASNCQRLTLEMCKDLSLVSGDLAIFDSQHGSSLTSVDERISVLSMLDVSEDKCEQLQNEVDKLTELVNMERKAKEEKVHQLERAVESMTLEMQGRSSAPRGPSVLEGGSQKDLVAKDDKIRELELTIDKLRREMDSRAALYLEETKSSQQAVMRARSEVAAFKVKRHLVSSKVGNYTDKWLLQVSSLSLAISFWTWVHQTRSAPKSYKRVPLPAHVAPVARVPPLEMVDGVQAVSRSSEMRRALTLSQPPATLSPHRLPPTLPQIYPAGGVSSIPSQNYVAQSGPGSEEMASPQTQRSLFERHHSSSASTQSERNSAPPQPNHYLLNAPPSTSLILTAEWLATGGPGEDDGAENVDVQHAPVAVNVSQEGLEGLTARGRTLCARGGSGDGQEVDTTCVLRVSSVAGREDFEFRF